MEIKQQLRLSQQLVMTPQLQQAIKLLQMSRVELTEMVQEELLENPVLEDSLEGRDLREISLPDEPSAFDRQIASDERELTKVENRDKKDDIDWERYMENASVQGQSSFKSAQSGEDLPGIDQTFSRADGLSEHLLWQMRMGDFLDEELVFGALVIGNINETGYLVIDDVAPADIVPKLAEEAGLDAEDAEEVLRMMQRFDPVGVCSRTLQECLLVQAEVLGMDDLVMRVLREHMSELENRNYNKIALKLEVAVEEIYDVAQVIMDLEPRPGRDYVVEEPRYITPDVYVQRVGDDYVISPNDEGMPKLKISGAYDHVPSDAKAKEYLANKVRSAQWLIRSIDQRRRTIVRVTECIVEKQREFFDRGVQFLKPMILRDVAETVGMHESTISRVTSNKYVSTPQGLFELKYFFNSAIKRDGQEDIASESVKRAIASIIAEEDSKNPSSDQLIVEALREKHGMKIARRTVAKYREELGILSSSKRKQYF